jgi:hypothetical protein
MFSNVVSSLAVVASLASVVKGQVTATGTMVSFLDGPPQLLLDSSTLKRNSSILTKRI